MREGEREREREREGEKGRERLCRRHFHHSYPSYSLAYLVSRREVEGLWSSLSNELVHQPDVGKGSSSHDRVVAPARPVGVELAWGQPTRC